MDGGTRSSAAAARRAEGLIRLVSITSAVLIVVLLLNGWYAFSAARRLGSEDLQLVRLAGRIVHLDEVLTMSARMAAQTGDARWTERYRAAEPKLDAAIGEVIALAPESEREAMELTNEANLALVALEAACLEAVAEGRLDDARELVFDERYDRLKSHYREGVESMIGALDHRTQRSVAAARTAAIVGGLVALLGVVASFAALALGVARSRREEALRVELRFAARRSTMGRLASSLSHELNQPLAAIVHYSGAATAISERHDGPHELRSVLDGIAQQAERAGAIVQRVREFARPSAPRRAAVDVGEVLRDALLLVVPEARVAGVELETDVARPVPSISGDAIQIQQVLVNLLLNAIEASPPGGRVEVRVRAAAGRVELEVADEGVGISPEESARVFEAFYTTKPEGLGLGLAVSRDIVEALGGEIVHEPGRQGSRFRVSLPEHGP